MEAFFISMFLNLFIAAVLRPKAKQQEPSVKLEDLEFPTADRGRKVPVVIGRRHVLAPNAVWFSANEPWQTGPGGAYTHFSGSMHLVIAHAPTVLYNIHVDKKTLGLTEVAGRSQNSLVIARLDIPGSHEQHTIHYDEDNLKSVLIKKEDGGADTISCNYTFIHAKLINRESTISCTMQGLSSGSVPVTVESYNEQYGVTGLYLLYVRRVGDNFEAGITIRSGEFDYEALYSQPDIATVSGLTYDATPPASVSGGVIVDSFSTHLSLPELLGGETKGGGIVGDITYLSGLTTPPSTAISFLESKQGGVSPHYLGVSSLLIKECTLGANSASVAPWGFDVGGYFNSLGVDDHKAIIGEGANAGCFLYECLINTEWGKGEDPDNIDKDSFKEVANTLYDEGIGCFFVWSEAEAIDVIMDKVLGDIFGLWIPDPYTGGKIKITLMRAYQGVITTLPVVTPLKIVQGKARQANQGTNQVTVNYKTHGAYEDERNSFTVTNQSALQLSGGKVLAKTIDLPTIGTSSAAQKIANLHLMVESLPLTTYTVTLDQFDFNITPGMFVYYADPDGNSITYIHRVLDVDIKDRQTTVTLLEDMYSYALSLETTTFGALPTVGKNPSEVLSLPFQLLGMIPNDLTPTPKPNNTPLDAIGLLSNYIEGASSSSLRYSGGGARITTGSKSLSYMTNAVPVGSHWQEKYLTQLTVTGGVNIPSSGTYLGYVCTGEWIRVDSYDQALGTAEITRGVLGTVPTVIPKGTVIFLLLAEDLPYATSTHRDTPWVSTFGVSLSETLNSDTGTEIPNQRVLNNTTYVHESITKAILTPNKVLDDTGATLVNNAQVTVASSSELVLTYDVFIRYPFIGSHIVSTSDDEVSGLEEFSGLSKSAMKSKFLYVRDNIRVRARVINMPGIVSTTHDSYNPADRYELSSKVTTGSLTVPATVVTFTVEIVVEYFTDPQIVVERSNPFTLSYTRSGTGIDVDLVSHLSPANPTIVEI